jgi:hypothetical protein
MLRIVGSEVSERNVCSLCGSVKGKFNVFPFCHDAAFLRAELQATNVYEITE